ncbi:acyl carrier protein [Pontibacter sp. G13]|uniref:acyl carrier protein n=1 Tax=Pontibacter sp. G13 TaxID=3074898 RepID=UPI002889448F|nr:acyl carrier protein [Pontibacter sp. G13]WNJ18834.1 acyl carrier protein [Pontibacter sp. G13]
MKENLHPSSTLALQFTNLSLSAHYGALSQEVQPTPKSKSISLESHIKSLVLEISGEAESHYQDEASLKDDLAMDSLDMVELVMLCERDFFILLPDHEWSHIQTVGELVELIRAKTA